MEKQQQQNKNNEINILSHLVILNRQYVSIGSNNAGHRTGNKPLLEKNYDAYMRHIFLYA